MSNRIPQSAPLNIEPIKVGDIIQQHTPPPGVESTTAPTISDLITILHNMGVVTAIKNGGNPHIILQSPPRPPSQTARVTRRSTNNLRIVNPRELRVLNDTIEEQLFEAIDPTSPKATIHTTIRAAIDATMRRLWLQTLHMTVRHELSTVATPALDLEQDEAPPISAPGKRRITPPGGTAYNSYSIPPHHTSMNLGTGMYLATPTYGAVITEPQYAGIILAPFGLSPEAIHSHINSAEFIVSDNATFGTIQREVAKPTAHLTNGFSRSLTNLRIDEIPKTTCERLDTLCKAAGWKIPPTLKSTPTHHPKRPAWALADLIIIGTTVEEAYIAT